MLKDQVSYFLIAMSCRGNDGELRLGIRRAVQLKNGTPGGALYSHGLNHGVLEAISGAISSKREFQIYYNPRYDSGCNLL